MKIPYWATIFTIVGVMILCALGLWQLKRLAWKVEILAQIDNAFKRISTLDITPLSLKDDIKRNNFMIAASVHGRYLHDKEIWLQSRPLKGESGYHIITPFAIENNGQTKILLVNRGWVPINTDRDNVSINRPQGSIELLGMLVNLPEQGWRPDNDPAHGIWYTVNLPQFEQSLNLKNIMPKILYVSQPSQSQELPASVMMNLRSNIKNNHAQYAFFWFSMSVVLIGVYFIRFCRPEFKKPADKF